MTAEVSAAVLRVRELERHIAERHVAAEAASRVIAEAEAEAAAHVSEQRLAAEREAAGARARILDHARAEAARVRADAEAERERLAATAQTDRRRAVDRVLAAVLPALAAPAPAEADR